MDSLNGGKKKQNRSKGKCWGCDREDVELVSSISLEGVQRRICDACRKAISNHAELDPVAILASRRQPRGQSVSRDKLIALNTQLTKLINALHKIGADEQVRDAIRTLVEPYLMPIADDIWPKRRPVPVAGPEQAPVAHSVSEGTTEVKLPGEVQIPQSKERTKLAIPVRKPPKAQAKAAAKEQVIDKSKGSPYYMARKAFDRVNWKRKKKGLAPLPKPEPEELLRQYLDRQAKKQRAHVH